MQPKRTSYAKRRTNLRNEPYHADAKGLISEQRAKRAYHDPRTNGVDAWSLPKGHKKRKQRPGTQARHGITCATISQRELAQVSADPTPCRYAAHDTVAKWAPKGNIPKGF